MRKRFGVGIRCASMTAALALSLAIAAPALAQDGPASTGDDPDPTPQAGPSLVSPLKPDGGTQWSVFYGFGISQRIYLSAAGIHVASAGVRWAHMWSARGGSFLRGHPTIALEAMPVTTFVEAGKTTWAAGANLLYEHHFAVKGRVLPVWKFGAGLLYADRAIPEGETQFNFSVISALGFDFMVTDSSALFVGYRFHHVSNANTGNLNPGINAHTVIFGLSFYR